ncbi:4Fe-4S binding protein [Amantichitinum ursilacus]|uniref:Putative electron transport protein YccM n=1 Tax=Amantichitinum ursilacus TaxID=857265 RepID=A0A0N0XME0_9NEIS|nr:4Fe-4S binding protein [Amantichitinum ursilacus]KPC54607.1 putative electron transport protein YccM [Amantichitinum ursilacus]
MSVTLLSSRFLARAGDWLARHRGTLIGLQWLVVVFYASLLIIPTLLPLPDSDARILNNLTVFAQFLFWGIWWPFVLLSMVLLGRAWCGVLCPEGALSEFTSRFGLNRAMPHWLRWSGWPFVAFAGTTIYGQMVSVYQYPQAVLVVLGGSTVAAMIIGLIYARDRRAWCKYLCPVNGVFNLLSRLAPIHFRVDVDAWKNSYHSHKVIPIVCAPMVPIRNMQGNAECHMCGRCSSHRDAITLSPRSPNAEIVRVGPPKESMWQTALLLFGMLGIAIGAFQWTVSPWMVTLKQACAEWLINHDIMWPLEKSLPWYVFTNYPLHNDVFTILDGTLVVAWIVGVGALMGCVLSALLALGNGALGKWDNKRFQHLALALVPLAGCGLFLGLSATTVSLLRPEGVNLTWVQPLRFTLLAGANLWTGVLALGIVRRYAAGNGQRVLAWLSVAIACAVVDLTWWLMFGGWTVVQWGHCMPGARVC